MLISDSVLIDKCLDLGFKPKFLLFKLNYLKLELDYLGLKFRCWVLYLIDCFFITLWHRYFYLTLCYFYLRLYDKYVLFILFYELLCILFYALYRNK